MSIGRLASPASRRRSEPGPSATSTSNKQTARQSCERSWPLSMPHKSCRHRPPQHRHRLARGRRRGRLVACCTGLSRRIALPAGLLHWLLRRRPYSTASARRLELAESASAARRASRVGGIHESVQGRFDLGGGDHVALHGDSKRLNNRHAAVGVGSVNGRRKYRASQNLRGVVTGTPAKHRTSPKSPPDRPPFFSSLHCRLIDNRQLIYPRTAHNPQSNPPLARRMPPRLPSDVSPQPYRPMGSDTHQSGQTGPGS